MPTIALTGLVKVQIEVDGSYNLKYIFELEVVILKQHYTTYIESSINTN